MNKEQQRDNYSYFFKTNSTGFGPMSMFTIDLNSDKEKKPKQMRNDTRELEDILKPYKKHESKQTTDRFETSYND